MKILFIASVLLFRLLYLKRRKKLRISSEGCERLTFLNLNNDRNDLHMRKLLRYVLCLSRKPLRLKRKADRTEQVVKSEAMLMAQHAQSMLFRLPSEIRRQIYEAVIDLPATDHISLLCVCRKVNLECSEFYFRRPLVCHSQNDLVDFTASHSIDILQNITNLRVRLEELDPAVMQPFLAARVMGLPFHIHEHPYYQEAQRIVGSLGQLPKLQHLTILPPKDRNRSASTEGVLNYVLSWAERNYPNLESLNLSIDAISLTCLSGFKNLNRLQLSGFSLTSPEVATQLLGELKCLKELIIVGPPEELRWRQSLGYDMKVTQSITAGGILELPPLKSFTLCEIEGPSANPPAFMTKGLLLALYDGHRESLRDFHFSSASAPDSRIQEFLAAFLMSTTNIRSLMLGWPNMEVEFLDCLPPTTDRVELAVQSNVHAQAVMDRLMMIRYRLPYLRFVALNLVNPVKQAIPVDEKEEVAFAMPMQSMSTLLRMPWTVSWGVFQPTYVGA